MDSKVSVIMPAYNEEATIEEIIRRVLATGLVHELIVVDDGSTDQTTAILQRVDEKKDSRLRIQYQKQNRGKGAAIRAGLEMVTGDLVLVQDADLEYDPAEYPALLAPMIRPEVQAVYGSRNVRANPHSSFAFYWGGRFLSWMAGRLHHIRLTDEATGYKVVRTFLLRELDLQANGFAFCAELTGKLLRRGITIHEVAISYRPRSWNEGKKIRWYDGLIAIWTLLKYR